MRHNSHIHRVIWVQPTLHLYHSDELLSSCRFEAHTEECATTLSTVTFATFIVIPSG